MNGEICDDVAYPIDETNCNGLIPQNLNTPNGIPSQFASIVAKPFSCFKKVVMVAFLDQTPVILLRTKCVKVPKLYGLHTTNFESVVWQNVRPLSTKKVCSLHPSFMTYVVYMNATFGGNMPTCPINQLRSRLEKSNEVLICFYPFGEHNDDVSTLLRIPHPDLTPNEIDDQAEAKHMLDKNVPRKMYEMMASFVSIPTPSDSIYGRCKEPKLSANDIMRMTGAEDAIKRAKSTTTNNALANNNNNNRNALPLKHKRDTENDARMQRHMKKNSSNSSRFVKDEASGDDSDDTNYLNIDQLEDIFQFNCAEDTNTFDNEPSITTFDAPGYDSVSETSSSRKRGRKPLAKAPYVQAKIRKITNEAMQQRFNRYMAIEGNTEGSFWEHLNLQAKNARHRRKQHQKDEQMMRTLTGKVEHLKELHAQALSKKNKTLQNLQSTLNNIKHDIQNLYKAAVLQGEVLDIDKFERQYTHLAYVMKQ